MEKPIMERPNDKKTKGEFFKTKLPNLGRDFNQDIRHQNQGSKYQATDYTGMDLPQFIRGNHFV